MNFFTRKMPWNNLEFIPFKLCAASIYLYIGSHYHALFEHYSYLLLGVFALTVVITMYLWIQKMRQAN
jgi:uncharacterized membrane protein (DUF2068 family)